MRFSRKLDVQPKTGQQPAIAAASVNVHLINDGKTLPLSPQ